MIATRQIQKPALRAICGRCGVPVLEALADGALPVRCDPHALTPAGELAARLDRRPVCNVTAIAGGAFLTVRFGRHIRYGEKCPVVTEHKCGRPIGPVDAEQSAALYEMLLPARRKEMGQCPF